MTSSEKNSTRPKRVPEKLRAASDALEYEIRMLNDVADMLPNHLSGVIHNTLVESFVVHTRILIEFFYPTKSDSDTMIAPDFFTDGNQWERDIPGWLKEIRTRVHKLLAHLSYSRVLKYKDDKEWPYPIIRENLNNLFNDFFKNALPDRIGNKLREYKVPSKSNTPISSILASTGTACTTGTAVTRDLLR